VAWRSTTARSWPEIWCSTSKLADEGAELTTLAAELRARSQLERKAVFWAVGLTPAIDRELKELYRSKEILAKKERDTKGGDDAPALLHEERQRQRRHGEELRRLLKAACLSGSVYFQGNDRSPGDSRGRGQQDCVGDPGCRAANGVRPLPRRGGEPADVKKGLDALSRPTTSTACRRCSPTWRCSATRRVNRCSTPSAGRCVRSWVGSKSAPTTATLRAGASWPTELAKEPFGWDFECAAAGAMPGPSRKVEATSKARPSTP